MDDRYDRVKFHGVIVDKMTRQALQKMEQVLGYELTIVQGSYNRGGVSASAGTHDGGGAVDLAPWDAERKVLVGRKVGCFAMWERLPSQGPWAKHVHGILIGNDKASRGAKNQVVAYRAGRNGLVANRPDDGPRVTIKAFSYDPTWAPGQPIKRTRVTYARHLLALSQANLLTVARQLELVDQKRAAVRAAIPAIKTAAASITSILKALPKVEKGGEE